MFRHRKRLTAGLLGSILLLAGCGGGTENTAEGVSPGVDVENKTITLGGWRQQSGATSVLDQLTQAALARIEQINANGGINGWKITWDIPDAANDPSKALQITRDQIENDKVLALFAGMGSASNGPVMPYVVQSGVPYIAPQAATDPYFCGTQYPAVFPYSPPVGPTAALLVRYAHEKLGAKKFFIAHQDDQTGQPAKEILEKFVPTLPGAELIGSASFSVTDTDLTGVGRAIADAKPDVVFWQGGQATQMIKGKEAAQARGLKDAIWMGPNTFADQNNAKLAPAVYEGMYFYLPTTPFWETDDPAVKEFLAGMEKAGLPANALTSAGWGPVEVLIAAIKGATDNGKTPTREGLIEALEALGETGEMGIVPGVSYKKGEHLGIVKYHIIQYKNGEFTTLERGQRIPDVEC